MPPSMLEYRRWVRSRRKLHFRLRRGSPTLFKLIALGAPGAGVSTLLKSISQDCRPVPIRKDDEAGASSATAAPDSVVAFRLRTPYGLDVRLEVSDGSLITEPQSPHVELPHTWLLGLDALAWVYDATDRQSFLDASSRAARVMKQLRANLVAPAAAAGGGPSEPPACGTSYPDVMPLHFIVGAKSDRVAAGAAPAASEADIAAFAAELVGDDMGCLRHVMTSAATGAGVDDFARTVACALEADSLDDEAAAEAGVRRIRGRDYSNDAWGQCAFM